MLEALNNKKEFKQRNLTAWKNNTEFWLNSDLRQLVDNKDFLLRKLPIIFKNLPSAAPCVVDMGTGSGWAFEILQLLEIKCQFLGLDFNPLFIDHLKNKHKASKQAKFLTLDLEEELPPDLYDSADIVFNFFNFFELGDLEKGMANAEKMLKPGGKLIVMTIDSYYLMFALAKHMSELKEVLNVYEDKKSKGEVPFFFQKIDTGNAESDDFEYASVLYSFKDYYLEARKHNLVLNDFDEIVKTSKFIPKVYQYIEFKKEK